MTISSLSESIVLWLLLYIIYLDNVKISQPFISGDSDAKYPHVFLKQTRAKEKAVLKRRLTFGFFACQPLCTVSEQVNKNMASVVL